MQLVKISPWAIYDEATDTYIWQDGKTTVAWTFPSVTGTVAISRTDNLVLFMARETLAHTDTTNKTLFTLPANAVIVDIICHITTAFNGSGADNLDVGTTVADPDEYVDNLDCSATGVNRCGDAGDMPATARGSVGTSAITVLGKYTDANSDASAGAATIEIIWILA